MSVNADIEDNSTRLWLQTHHTIDEHPSDAHSYDLQLIENIRRAPNLYGLLAASLCDHIYGHKIAKSALVLALMTGASKRDPFWPHISTRGSIHLLLFGDHHSGKDLLLKSVHSCSPTGHYVYGNASTITSLKSPYNQIKDPKHAFKKGSLVSSHTAICCVDDFDRMNAIQKQTIQEVLDYQDLWTNKDNRFQTLAANTSIIAAVNPVNGAYDMALNVWQNTKVSKTLLSKFDLILDLIDTPNEDLDLKLSVDVLNRHKKSLTNTEQNVNSQTQTSMSSLVLSGTQEEPRLIPHESIRHYVKYAQNFIHPVISDGAYELLNEFSQQMAASDVSKSMTRNLETLYRLTEARARVELRDMATEEDALDVIDIMKHSIAKHYVISDLMDSVNHLHSFKGCSKKQNTKNLLKALQTVSQQKQQNMFSVDQIVDICATFQIPFDSRDEILQAIDRLNSQTIIIKNGSNYKLI